MGSIKPSVSRRSKLSSMPSLSERISNTVSNPKSLLLSLPFILVVAALLRVVALIGFEGLANDGSARVGDAYNWLTYGTPFLGRSYWPEGNYLLPAFGLYVWDDLYWSPKILYALVALSNIWALYRLTESAIGWRSAALAAWIITLLPFHIMVSANSAMSETPYVTLCLLSVWAAVRYVATPNVWLAAAAGLLIAMAATFRYDAIILGLPMAACIAAGAWCARIGWFRSMRDVAIFGVCGLLYAGFIISVWFHFYPDDPAVFIKESKLNTEQFFVNGHHPRWSDLVYQTYTILFWPGSIFILLTPAIAALGFVGVASEVRNWRLASLLPVLCMVMIWSWLSYAAYQHRILAQWRYSLSMVILLSMFVHSGIVAASRWSAGLTPQRIVLGTMFLAIATQAVITFAVYQNDGSIGRQFASISPLQPGQFDSRDLLRWLNENLKEGESALITSHPLQAPYFVHVGELKRQGRVATQGVYIENSTLVHTRESLSAELEVKLHKASFVATSGDSRQIGLRDGLSEEVLRPLCDTPKEPCTWRGVDLEHVRNFGSIRLWRVLSVRSRK